MKKTSTKNYHFWLITNILLFLFVGFTVNAQYDVYSLVTNVPENEDGHIEVYTNQSLDILVKDHLGRIIINLDNNLTYPSDDIYPYQWYTDANDGSTKIDDGKAEANITWNSPGIKVITLIFYVGTDEYYYDLALYVVERWYLDSDDDGLGYFYDYIDALTDPSDTLTKYVLNSDDQCPTDPGLAENNGCIPMFTYYRDSDIDGLGDAYDSVLDASNSGLSGYVDNADDQCPTLAGPVENDGCPIIVISDNNENYVKTTVYSKPHSDIGLEDLTFDLELNEVLVESEYVASNTIVLKPGTLIIGEVSLKIDNSYEEATHIKNITYLDGLGKPIQKIAIRASLTGKDIIQHIEYDEFGRTAQKYLPYVSTQNDGSLVLDAKTNTLSYYQNNYGDSQPYSESFFDNSPLNQVTETAQVGQDFTKQNSRTAKSYIGVNNTTDRRVKKYLVEFVNGLPTIYVNGSPNYYLNNRLVYSEEKDANWVVSDGLKGVAHRFKDKNGRIILERVFDDNEDELNTYYVYDKKGNLTFVIPPIAETKIISNSGWGILMEDVLTSFCYQYRYDDWNRLIEKKIPNQDWEYIVYDSNDRPILSQDGNLRADNFWAFSKYDVYGRDIYSGLYSSTADRATLQTAVDTFTTTQNLNNSEERSSTTTNIGQVALNYDNTAFPITGISEVLAVNYYDNYNFTDANKPGIPIQIFGQTVTTRTNGLQTASWIKTLGKTTWAKNYLFYDEKDREIKVVGKNHLGGTTEIENELDFSGNLLKTTTVHKKEVSDTPITILDEFSYDTGERLLKHEQQINNLAKETISENNYNELGIQIQKKVGGQSTALQTIDYTYNIQGSLKEVNSVETALSSTTDNDLFAYKLNYHNALEGTATTTASALYNGGISQSIWRSAIADEKQSYTYTFDKLNRISTAQYGAGNTLSNDTDKFKLEGLSYNRAGNIKKLRRTGVAGQIDDLTFNYYNTGFRERNQLFGVSDASANVEGYTDTNPSGDNYTYDSQGRLIADQNKGITSIDYNYLDLPEYITFANGNQIEIVYDATGNKLEKIYTTTSGTTSSLYLSGFQYQDQQLLFFAEPEGYFNVTSQPASGLSGNYVYVYADHLGNNRLSYSDIDVNGTIGINEVLSASNYYPMGMLHSGELVTDSQYNYKFQGKALQNENGLLQYDFGSRMYDPSIGRWHVIDPQAESFYSYSPYMAMGNNPIMMVDPDGEFIVGVLFAAWLLTSETGYDIQKMVSPVAVHIDFTYGTHQKGLGIDVSIGLPQVLPISYRVNAGATYYWKNDFTGKGWETRKGAEWGFFSGLVILGGTDYDSPGEEFDQTLQYARFGPPGLNIKYANDWFFDLEIPGIPKADGGDRFRTGAGKLQIGPIHVGFNIFTGDPGLNKEDRDYKYINGVKTYVETNGNNPNKYRAGLGYVRFGPFSFGRDNENIRSYIQNDIIHSRTGDYYFDKLKGWPDRSYFQFGWGLGRLW